jgi:hypothetical protein
MLRMGPIRPVVSVVSMAPRVPRAVPHGRPALRELSINSSSADYNTTVRSCKPSPQGVSPGSSGRSVTIQDLSPWQTEAAAVPVGQYWACAAGTVRGAKSVPANASS